MTEASQKIAGGKAMEKSELDAAMSYWDRYEDGQLSAAFDLVKNRENWKYPIDAVVPLDADKRLISDAVTYYAGGMAEFVPVTRKGRQTGWRVVSGGYYENIGS